MFTQGLLPYFFNSSDKQYLLWLGMGAVVIVAYLLGSVNSAIIVSKILYRDDIRKHGSGNAGLTNMHRVFGLKAAGLTLLGDVMKTVFAVLLSLLLFGFTYKLALCTNPLAYIAGVFAVIGHAFPVYYGFRGGKGVLATATMALVVSPIIFAILFLIFVLIVKLSKYISLGSVSVAILYPVFLNAYSEVLLNRPPFWTTVFSTIILAIFIVWLHRENLKRINDRTESKFSFKRKAEVQQKDEEDDE